MNGFSTLRWLLNATLALYACCAATAATQTLTVNTNGSGFVSRNPTNTVLPRGAVVTLTAIPSTNWIFTSWSGDATGSANPTNVTMDADKLITANFSPIPSYTLTINVTGQGSVSPPGGTYPHNTNLSLMATPAFGWRFSEWTGDVTSTSNPVSVTMDTNKAVTAAFVEPPRITAQPQNAAVGVGANVTFSAVVSGTLPLSLTWQFNGAPISGATNSSLTISNVQLSHAGLYRMLASNPYGAATSQVARLTLTNALPGSNAITICDEVELRRAIAQGGHVRFACNGSITLTSGIDVANTVSLDGGSNRVIISGQRLRLFNVAATGRLAMTNLVLANGFASGEGGAIRNLGGAVHLVSCVLSNNDCLGHFGRSSSLEDPFPTAGGPGRGGAIFNENGTIWCHTVLMTANSVAGGRGGTYFLNPLNSLPPGDGSGGAIYSTGGTIVLTNCSFEGNHAHGLSHSSPSRGRGGAIEIAGGDLSIGASRFVGNFALGESTPPEIPPRTGYRPGTAEGGALSISSGRATVLRSGFFGNSALSDSGTLGGAIYNLGVLGMWDSTCSSNVAGGLYNLETAYINRTTFSHNVGAGVYNTQTMLITNSTLALNGGNGLQNALGGTLYLVNSTVASNMAAQNLANTDGSVTLRNSLLAHGVSSSNASGIITDGGFNMSSDGSCNFNSGSSFNFTDPMLDELRNNGGPTPTMALLPDSPARDFGSAAGAPPTDQRGVRRPYGLGVDIGAFEVGPRAAPSLTVARNSSMFELSFPTESGATYELQRSSDLVSWETYEVIGPVESNGLVSRRIPTTGPRHFFRVAVR